MQCYKIGARECSKKTFHMSSKSSFFLCVSLSMCTSSYTVSDSDTHARGGIKKKGKTEDSYVIEVSTLQFDLHPINVPGIAFAQLEKIGFSG